MQTIANYVAIPTHNEPTHANNYLAITTELSRFTEVILSQ